MIRAGDTLRRLIGEVIFVQADSMLRFRALEIANMILITFKMHRLMIKHRPPSPDERGDGSTLRFKRWCCARPVGADFLSRSLG